MTDRIGQRQFELIAAAIAATIASHLPHLPAWLSIGASAVIAGRVLARRRGAKPVPAWLRFPAAGLLLLAVITLYGNVFGREPGSVLGCGLLALKLLETERVRDARVAIGFAGFVLMSALLFVQTLWFTLAVSAVLVLLVASLISLQPAPLKSAHPLRRELTLAALLLGTGLPLAAAGFALIPRLGSPLWGSPGRDMQARTGLSDHMEPGSLTDLLIDDSAAFRVAFDTAPPPPAQRYFRAIVLWDFDGTSWTTERRGRGYLKPEPAASESAPIDYAITLEPTDRRWLPALDLPLTAPPNARLGADRVILADDPVAQPREYRVRSATRYTLAPSLTASERMRALALPDGFNPRTRALAESWRAEGRDDDAIVRAALDLYHRSFTYTLSPPLLGRDSVDDFLFSTRKGFCEHYASSFVVLMRAAGIPARVVTGYQGGWWNPVGYLLVRNADAHAWAETWSPGRGWTRVDPTAAVSPARIEQGAAAANDSASWSQSAWLRELRNRFDIINGLWTRSIIRFDALRQKGLLTPFGVASANQGDLLLAFSAVLGLILIVATLWAMRETTSPGGDALDAAWNRFGRRLARAGFARKPNEGPLDWLARSRDAPALSAAMNGLVQRYVALRYGEAEPAPERVRAFAQAVRNFQVPVKIEPTVRSVQR